MNHKVKGIASLGRLDRQHGFSMVELGLYLLLVTVLGLFGWSKYAANQLAAQTDTAASEVMTLAGKVKNTYTGNYAAVSNAKISGNNMLKNATQISDNAGTIMLNIGSATLTATPGQVTTSNDSVQYVLGPLPDDACTPMATTLLKGATKLMMGAATIKAPGQKTDASLIECKNDSNMITMLVQ